MFLPPSNAYGRAVPESVNLQSSARTYKWPKESSKKVICNDWGSSPVFPIGLV